MIKIKYFCADCGTYLFDTNNFEDCNLNYCPYCGEPIDYTKVIASLLLYVNKHIPPTLQEKQERKQNKFLLTEQKKLERRQIKNIKRVIK